MSIQWKGFIVAVLIFTGVQVLVEPLMMRIALTSARRSAAASPSSRC